MDTYIKAHIAEAKKHLGNLERDDSAQNNRATDNLKDPSINGSTLDKICLEMDLQVAQTALLLNQFVRWSNE